MKNRKNGAALRSGLKSFNIDFNAFTMVAIGNGRGDRFETLAFAGDSEVIDYANRMDPGKGYDRIIKRAKPEINPPVMLPDSKGAFLGGMEIDFSWLGDRL
jgi:hypothetical protein